jgi:hypothetical protein
MAPELIEGEPACAATDAFALGMTAFEALLGDCPLSGSAYAIASTLSSGAIPRAAASVPGADPVLLATLDGLLAPRSAARLPIGEARRRLARRAA